jgi:O-antigen ligase
MRSRAANPRQAALHLPAAMPLMPRPAAQASRLDGLMMTDYLFWAALAAALFVAVDPLELVLEQIAAIKHLPLLLALISLALALVGNRVFQWRRSLPGVVSPLAPLLCLAALILAGSIYARFLLHVQNSFLDAGLYMLAAPIAAAALLRSGDPLRLVRGYAVMLLLMAVVVFVGLALNYGVRQVYHELEYLFPPLAVLAVFAARRAWLRWLGLLFFLLCAFLFHKNTGYLSGLIAVAYLMIFYIWPRWRRHQAVQRLTRVHWTLIAILVLGAALAFFFANRTHYLPSGNPQFRLLTYQRAWERFLASPYWGTWFTAPGAEKFTGFNTGVSNNILPTHSDVLDLMANGGVFAMLLWLWALLRIARLAFRSILHADALRHPLAPYAHLFACMSLAGVLTYSFNPILLQPCKAFLLWANLGFLAGIALLAQSGAAVTMTKENR